MTFDEARMMANVNDRAQRLFEGGYRARWKDGAILHIRSPKGDVYCLDIEAEKCDCPFFQKHSGRYQCKHSLGWRRLVQKQRTCRRLVTLTLLRVWANLDDNSSHSRKPQEPRCISGMASRKPEADHAIPR